MHYPHINYKKLIPFLFLAALAIVIISLTIGKEIYGNQGHSISSFAIVNFSGYLFFLVMPVEVAFAYYLHQGLDPFMMNFVAIATAILAQIADYYIGRSFSSRFIDRLIGRRRYEKAENEIRKYGNLAIFIFNLFPISSPVILLAAGMLKHRFKEAMIYSLAGLMLKYLVLTLIIL